MKIHNWLLFSFVFFFVMSCTEEVEKSSSFTNNKLRDTTYINQSVGPAQEKVALLEEFTGVTCINCPNAHTKIKELIGIYGAQLAVISIHNQDAFTNPIKDTDPALYNEYANAIGTFFGSPAKPSGGVDRVKNANGSLVFGLSDWQSLIEERLQVAPKINLSLEKLSSTEFPLVKAKIEFTESIDAPVNYTLALVENKIKAAQKFPNKTEYDYYHYEVLRKIYTNKLGTPLSRVNGIFEKGRTFEFTLQTELDNTWQQDELYYVLFVTNENTKEVIQALQIPFKS
ncbi:MAG: Omp28-related outer membrane protein [Chitinophagales bacterium]|jgi:hypothetical protein|nr:Omp28-related outer membrane protein [Chitinophagales bacterium]